MVQAGNRLLINDNSQELTTGAVVLETNQAFASEGFVLLIEYNHVPGNTDTGFKIECGSRFQYDDIGNLVFLFPQTVSTDVGTYFRMFPVGPYKMFYPIPMSVKNAYTRIFLTWQGTFGSLADLKLHYYPNSWK